LAFSDGTLAKVPVLGWQTLWLHAVSAPGSQVTTVAGLTLQALGNTVASQRSVPLHRLASSNLAQSALLAHWHRLGPFGTQAPALQVALSAQGSSL